MMRTQTPLLKSPPPHFYRGKLPKIRAEVDERFGNEPFVDPSHAGEAGIQSNPDGTYSATDLRIFGLFKTDNTFIGQLVLNTGTITVMGYEAGKEYYNFGPQRAPNLGSPPPNFANTFVISATLSGSAQTFIQVKPTQLEGATHTKFTGPQSNTKPTGGYWWRLSTLSGGTWSQISVLYWRENHKSKGGGDVKWFADPTALVSDYLPEGAIRFKKVNDPSLPSTLTYQIHQTES